MKIGDYSLAPDAPILLQVEAGVTHCGKLTKALGLIEAAADAGFNAVKFQCVDADALLSRPDIPFTDDRGVTKPIAEALKDAGTFTVSEWTTLRDACYSEGLLFYATCDSIAGVDLMESLKVPAHKACAHDLTYRPLLERMAQTRKPVLFDLGPATAAEDAAAWDILDARGIAMHAPHPTRDGDWMLSRMNDLGSYGHPWGYSAPGRESEADYAAVALGARILEKRVTLDRTDPDGHHHTIALEPDEAREWVQSIRRLEAAFTEPAWGYGSALQQAEMAKWRRNPSDWKRPLAR